jgi:DNA-binding MarR family transcriptional regulator
MLRGLCLIKNIVGDENKVKIISQRGENMVDINRSMEVTKLFKEIMSLFKHHMGKCFEDIGLTMPQSMVVGILSKFGKMKISELSSRMGLSNSTISGIIDRLEKQNIVVRERSIEDRRVVYVRLCSHFEEIHKDFHKKLEEKLANIISKGTQEEIEKIIVGFKTIKKLFEEQKIDN